MHLLTDWSTLRLMSTIGHERVCGECANTDWAALGGLAEGNGFSLVVLCLFLLFGIAIKNRNALRKTNREGKDKRREKRKRREKEKEIHRKPGCMWAVKTKRWMIKDVHADEENCNLKFLKTIVRDRKDFILIYC